MSQDEREQLVAIEAKIGLYPNFPKEGILFRDIMPVLSEPKLFDDMITLLAKRVEQYNFDRILGIESRGFLIGPLLAQKLKVPFGPVRKRGKLPGELYSIPYELEYGHDVLEVQRNGLPCNSRCLVVDDLIATGGSMEATRKLVEQSSSRVIAFVCIIELVALKGRDRLGNIPVINLFSY